MRKYGFLIALMFVAVFTSGCGPSEPVFKTGTISGTAKIGDSPFNANAVLMFMDNSSGQAYTAPVAADGTFTVDGEVRAGTYVVYLAPKLQGDGNADEQPMAVKIDTSVPEKYWNEATSDVKVTVEEGENTPTLVFEKS
ncbi:hypothetical protein [uncultured Gimesia sp.]|uniref:hypothetical protein n=1 Tax=uncultured Gimesia sp. TaxID=1678688 RepID=UPI0030D6E4E6|tara:strand:- start:8287 stop:8703 length:417 start_codon:yes stop_codon:yes gene_type:complete